MTNENVVTPFDMSDVDNFLEPESAIETPSAEPTAPQVPEPPIPTSVKDIDPYNPTRTEENPEEPVIETPAEADALHQYLMDRGISDTSKIQYEDEDGNPIEVNFDDLSKEEQLTIINELSRPNITDEEIQTIDYLRRNNMTLSQVVDYFADLRLQQYIEANGAPEQHYSIDDYSDEELFIADMKSKYPNYSDEKINAKLEAAKLEDDFSTEMEQLRSEYKAMEQKEAEYQAQQEAYAQEQYRNTLYNSINSFNEIALDYSDNQSDTLEIEVEDKQKALSYLLDADAEGKTQFVRDIENPDALVELAWLRTSGADALAGQSRYYKEIISERNKEIARLNDKIKKLQTSNSVVVPTEPKRTSKNSSSPWDSSGLL